jgi:WASH complex subunit CCDC53
MRPVPIQQTVLLLNNFITNTTIFLCDFADSCEKKISKVSAKINEIEITMAVLEAKLGSIPGLEYNAGKPTTTTTSTTTTTTTTTSTTYILAFYCCYC